MVQPKLQGTIHMPSRGVEAMSRSVIVAVKAEKVISKTALSWTITHVARPGDCILLLAVLYEKMNGGRRFWGFPRLKGVRRSSDRKKLPDKIGQISESCSQMVFQFHELRYLFNPPVSQTTIDASPSSSLFYFSFSQNSLYKLHNLAGAFRCRFKPLSR
ncbi:uncharacterized protein LOC111381786 [Olea europaea var. sylvestris]|uniref:uncharacterized protein LOC111381786 n=1 Tax=Olea europaea var. sylvestris TaxID=158386 RepID=UPI000C1D7184|nr:uncharacterized protein LOC111381786 [Olea europaea var. sylvestris]